MIFYIIPLLGLPYIAFAWVFGLEKLFASVLEKYKVT